MLKMMKVTTKMINSTLAGWCSKNNINYLQEHMNIHKDAMDEIIVDNNVNEDF